MGGGGRRGKAAARAFRARGAAVERRAGPSGDQDGRATSVERVITTFPRARSVST